MPEPGENSGALERLRNHLDAKFERLFGQIGELGRDLATSHARLDQHEVRLTQAEARWEEARPSLHLARDLGQRWPEVDHLAGRVSAIEADRRVEAATIAAVAADRVKLLRWARVVAGVLLAGVAGLGGIAIKIWLQADAIDTALRALTQ